MSLVFPAGKPVLAPTLNGDDFPVRRVFCVARNYADHAREMGGNPEREPPFFFTKWAEAVVFNQAVVPYPQATRNLHYEAELVVAIGRAGQNIASDKAMAHVWGYACGLDMTRRDLQNEAKSAGRPWDIGKNFENASPLGVLHPADSWHCAQQGRVVLTVNGEIKQDGALADMIWPVADIIAFLSQFYTLQPGDLIYTGTPAGVGPVVAGDQLTVSIDGLTPLSITIASPE